MTGAYLAIDEVRDYGRQIMHSRFIDPTLSPNLSRVYCFSVMLAFFCHKLLMFPNDSYKRKCFDTNQVDDVSHLHLRKLDLPEYAARFFRHITHMYM